MNFILDVLIPKQYFYKLNLKEILVEWGGETFSQNPPKYSNNSMLVFHQNSEIEYYKSIVGKDTDIYNYVALSLEEMQLSELEFLINNEMQEASRSEVVMFLGELYNKLDSFWIILLRDEECIDNRYIVSDEKELVKVVCDSLRRKSPEGVLITKNKP